MKITLIRHGITEGNKRRLFYGGRDIPLLPEGEAELKRLAEAGGYPSAPRYYTSGMLRAEQSLKALYGDIPHGVLPDMRETDFGIFEMRSYEELLGDPEFLKWCEGDNEANVCPGGESGVITTERAMRALKTVIDAGEDAVIVAHGGVIGGLMMALFPGTGGRDVYTPAPGCGFTIEFKDGEPAGFTRVPDSFETSRDAL